METSRSISTSDSILPGVDQQSMHDSSGSPIFSDFKSDVSRSTVTSEGFETFSIITLVFFWLIFRPACSVNMPRRVVFSCMCWYVCETSTRSLEKSRSWRVEKRVHLMPCGRSNVVCRITQSMVRSRSKVNIRHRRLTSAFTPKLDLLFPALHLRCCWSPCGIPYALSMHHRLSGWILIESLLKNTTVSAIQCTDQWCWAAGP